MRETAEETRPLNPVPSPSPTTPSPNTALASRKQRSPSVLNIRVSNLFHVSSSLASVATMCDCAIVVVTDRCFAINGLDEITEHFKQKLQH
ncbi:hypothetical protein MUK42_34352 [Musa troglodytarum]|uniref:Uncharacterized protein n=1 Tax=Musa troglodytarum TaxID=320322 RepID=A0A9E7H2L6_9LILI|nr:hypothetical protein MUK42_34352 [Musa troglodytarum]